MLAIFEDKQKFNNKSLITQNKNNTLKIIENFTIENSTVNNFTMNNITTNKKSNLIFYPFSTKEWFTSIYSFNKSYTKSLIIKNGLVNILIKSYCNMLLNKIKVLFKRRRAKKIRYSANKIYTSRVEFKHTNSKISVTLFIYNKQKLYFENFLENILFLIQLKKKIVEGITTFIQLPENRLVHMVKHNFMLFRKWDVVFFKNINNALIYLITNLKKRYRTFYKIPKYYLKRLYNLIMLQKQLFSSIKWINFNLLKFNTLKINVKNLGLIRFVEKLYNKKVIIELVELKSIHLNSDVFSAAVALKLRERKNKAVTILRKAILQMVRIPDLHTLITRDDNTEEINKNNVINTIEQQIVSGVRFEASGRLTRRLTAMRAVFKYRYAGSLKNIRSSFNNMPSTMLRGHVKSNSQYTLINSKTRNGTFGLKGWVSSHTFKETFSLKILEYVEISTVNLFICLSVLIVGVGVVIRIAWHSSNDKKVWEYKVLHPFENERLLSYKKNPCFHPIVRRRHLMGDADFQFFKNRRCSGNNPVIRGIDDNKGALCTGCLSKFFCADPKCSCKKSLH